MKNIHRILMALVLGVITFGLSFQVESQILVSGILAIVAFLVSGFIFFLDKIIAGISGNTLLTVVTGLLLGFLFGLALNMAGKEAGFAVHKVFPLLYIVPVALFGITGYIFAKDGGFKLLAGRAFVGDAEGGGGTEKILDTSVIIDGRILDIAETNFIEGPFIIPNFVLREIQLISDSPDPVKRNRGRRGLEMLNKLQQNGSVKVKISYIDYADAREVDAKLVKLARETGAKLITNDFNLNKVAELQGVMVLNLNSLTNALKPVVLPGEDILIDVIKEGKDENQGIGYLEDGTMVVVENGRSLLGKSVRVNVTSIIQTAAGKMIFTRATGPAEDIPEPRLQQQQNRPNHKQQRREYDDKGDRPKRR